LDFELSIIKHDIKEMDEVIENIESQIPNEVNLGVVKIDCRKVKKKLIDKRERIKDRLTYIIAEVIKF